MDRAHARPLRCAGEILNAAALTSDEVLAFHRTLSNWGRWGEDDQLGTLHWISAGKRVAAAGLVRSGRTVGCSRELPTEPAADNERAVVHLMTGTAGEGWGGDYFALAPHGYAVSHIDALCHIFHDGRLYNGYPIERVTAHGALALAIDALRDGVVSRGVLLDVPALRGVPWLEAGEAIGPEELERAEAAAGLRVEAGDVLLVRTGRWALRAALGPWNPRERLAGLHARCLPWLFERKVAALGSDGVSDAVPSQVAGVGLPIHSVAIVAMGLHLLDNLDLDPLSFACREEGRWEFQVVVAPLVIARGTASPVNPIAIF
ncbi:MAG TPA: cyclase family protein [Myxococcota bacterium]|nr:cyclase family protein [Myxococcota bacterium]